MSLNGTTANGVESSEPPDDLDSWPTAATASKQYKVQVYAINRLGETSQVQRFKGSDGVWRYNPQGLYQHFGEEGLTTVAGLQSEVAEFVRSVNGALQMREAHYEKLFKMYQDDRYRTMEVLATQNAKLQEQVGQLLEKHWEAIAAREALASEQHNRDLANQIVAGQEKRKGEAFEIVKKVAPTVVDQIKESFALAQNPQIQAVQKLLKTFTRAQLEVFLMPEVGFVTDEQRAFIREILKHAPKPEETPAQAAPAPAQEAPAPAEPAAQASVETTAEPVPEPEKAPITERAPAAHSVPPPKPAARKGVKRGARKK